MANSTQYLFRRGHSWYFKRAVPADLQALIGKKQIVEALGTRDLSEAQSLRWERMNYWEGQFAEMRGSPRPSPSMTPREVYSEMLDYLRLSELPLPSSAGAQSAQDNGPTDFEIKQDLLREQAISEHGADENGNPLRMSPTQKAQWDALKVYESEAMGQESHLAREYGLSVSEATERYVARAAQRKDVQSILQHKATLRRLAEFVDDKALVKLSKADVGKFIGLLESFSNVWGKSPKDADLSLEELRLRYANKGKQLSDTTLNRHLTAIRGLWAWAVSAGEVTGDDPTVGLFRTKARNGSKANTYKPFSREELLALFSGKPPADHALLEVSLVALYSGMRLGEIVRLTWSDVRVEGGVNYFDIQEAKSNAGRRRVPVHGELSWLLERREEGGLLWPSLGSDDFDKVADRVSKKFRTYRCSKGLDGKGKVFHSFRKSFISTLARLGAQEAEIAQVVGHEHNQITFSVYNPDGFPIEHAKRLVDCFEVDGLNPREIVMRSRSRRRAG